MIAVASERTAAWLIVYYVKTAVPLLILSQEATCIASIARGQSFISLYCGQLKPRHWSANEVIDFVCVQLHLTMELNH